MTHKLDIMVMYDGVPLDPNSLQQYTIGEHIRACDVCDGKKTQLFSYSYILLILSDLVSYKERRDICTYMAK